MKQVNLEQRSQAWLDWRRRGVCASDAVVILRQSPYKSRWQLWLEKTGAEKSGLIKEPDLSTNPHVQRGIEQEDDARNLMEQALKDAPLLPVCAEWEQNPVLRASFDGITREGCPVELSTRGLVRWARLSLRFQGAPRVFEYALEQTLTARVEPAEKQAIHRLAEDIFGDLWRGGEEL